MNILFVNYGDFTTNSLNHIGGFANWLCAQGHDCIVAVPGDKGTLSAIPHPRFAAATYAEVLAQPACFSDGRPAEIIHAWTPREGVRKFVVAYQRLQPGTRLIVHLEDNEDHLLEIFGRKPVAELRDLPEQKYPFPMVDGLVHPVRYRQLLRLADGVTVINNRLREFLPSGVESHLLLPGVDFDLYRPQSVDPKQRADLGLKPAEKVIVFTGSVTYANSTEMQELYGAVKLLNESGVPVRLIRTGFTLPTFTQELGYDCAPWLIELGFVEKERLPGLLALADVLVQPGEAGAFNDYRLPSKIPEFFSAGRPVILPATNIGLKVADGREALVLPRAGAAEIAAACRIIFNNPELAAKLGRAARAYAEQHFDLHTNGTGLLGYYKQVMKLAANPAWSALAGTAETDLPAALANLATRIATPPPADRTTPKELQEILADLGRATRQLDVNLQERAQTIDDLKHHVAGLEETREILRQDIKEIRFHAAEHASQLEKQIARAHEICRLAEREVTRLQDELYQSQYRVQRMQATLSWRSTAVWRALRRKLIDPIFGPPRQPPPPPLPARTVRLSPDSMDALPPAARFHAHIDSPRRWPAGAAELPVRGWVVSEAGLINGIRARLGDTIYPGEYGLGRPDVGHNLKQFLGAGNSGFRINVTFTSADEKIYLEAEDQQGAWHVFYSQLLSPGSQVAVRGTYTHWVQEFDTLLPDQLDVLRAHAGTLKNTPLISVLMPAYNTPERWLVRAIESVRAQVYPFWELCVVDDASTQPQVRPVLERYARMDPRIKPVFRTENGHISNASNTALQAATGAFCSLLDHDDELAPHALFCIAGLLTIHLDAEVIYTDEDKIDEAGHRFDPHFKPDWNPELLNGQNYLSHLSTYRTATLRAIGGFQVGFEGSQDWDLALRVTEKVKPTQIHHIPRVLYHWRAIEGSTAMHRHEKNYATTAARRTLEEHFARLGESVALDTTKFGHWRVRRTRPTPPPLVTLVIPTRNRRELLIPCVEGILAKTDYPNFEILVADNDSDDPELLAFYERMKATGRFGVLSSPGPFNFSIINNRAVRHARGDLVGLLNNDLEVMHPEWLDELVSHAVRPGVGCVGAKLYYPDSRIQHAGVITGLGGVAGHAFKGFTREEPGTPQFRPHLVHNVSAVTAACLLIRKDVYLQAGGLDETHLAVAFNDVDFCLRVEDLGLRNIFTPFAELLHHESASRGAEDSPEKVRRFQTEIEVIKSRWGKRLLNDPAYNPNLTLDAEDFGLAYPPRVPSLAPELN